MTQTATVVGSRIEELAAYRNNVREILERTLGMQPESEDQILGLLGTQHYPQQINCAFACESINVYFAFRKLLIVKGKRRIKNDDKILDTLSETVVHWFSKQTKETGLIQDYRQKLMEVFEFHCTLDNYSSNLAFLKEAFESILYERESRLRMN